MGWILMIGSAGFLASMNWLKSFQDQPVLPLEKLVSLQVEAGTATAPAAVRQDKTLEPPPEIDLDILDRIVSEEGRSPEAAIPILRAVQVEYGYLPDEALKRVCELTEITPAQIAGTSSFYAQFRRSPVGKHIVKVCHGTACHVSGIVQITEELHRHLGIEPGEDTDPSREFTLENVACLGCCSLAPVIMVDEDTVGRLTPASACQALDAVEAAEVT
jgi:NADH:ubiquinone oxidoreductase subunit E